MFQKSGSDSYSRAYRISMQPHPNVVKKRYFESGNVLQWRYGSVDPVSPSLAIRSIPAHYKLALVI
jgi:hypothetical protein